jgi:hypothetical protein
MADSAGDDATDAPDATDAVSDDAASPDQRDSAGDADESADDSDEEWAGASDGEGRREVEVPLALYKRVTVFGTLIAVVSVLLGFVLLDAATLRRSSLRSIVAGGLDAVGVAPPAPILSGTFALAGLGSIAVGAGVYVLSTRFRTAGMGKSKDDADEDSSDG